MTPDQHERQQQLRTIRIRALEALRDHGPLRPLEVARWARIPRSALGAVLGWSVWRGYAVRLGRRYDILPAGIDWLRDQAGIVVPSRRPESTGPRRVGRW